MFWRREWPLLLLSILSFIGFGVLVWLKPLGDGYAQTYSPSASTQLTESENRAESILRTAPEKSLAPEVSSGADESSEVKATPSAAKTIDHGESLVPSVTHLIAESTSQSESLSPSVTDSIVGSATSAKEEGMPVALESSVGTSGNSVVLRGTSLSQSSVAVSTMVIIPVSDPVPVEIPSVVIEAIFDPFIESDLESLPQTKGQCTCQTLW